MLRMDNVTIKLDRFILEHIDLEVHRGEYFVILGPSGTGKSVILEAIAGFHQPKCGNIYIQNRNIRHIPPEHRNIGFVYQDYMLFPHLSVKDNIQFGLKFKQRSRQKRDDELEKICSMLRIGHLLDRDCVTLSGGEQQRVAFARAVATSPQLLLLDEVSSALDPATKESFKQSLKQLHRAMQTTTIHVTHDFLEARYLADRIAVVGNGRIQQIGTPEEIFNHSSSEFVNAFTRLQRTN